MLEVLQRILSGAEDEMTVVRFEPDISQIVSYASLVADVVGRKWIGKRIAKEHSKKPPKNLSKHSYLYARAAHPLIQLMLDFDCGAIAGECGACQPRRDVPICMPERAANIEFDWRRRCGGQSSSDAPAENSKRCGMHARDNCDVDVSQQ